MLDRDLYMFKRIKARIMVKDVASYIGCNYTLVSKFERGERNMKLDKVRRYQEFIDYHYNNN